MGAREIRSRRGRATTLVVVALTLLALAVLPGSAAAARPPLLWQVPEDGLSGSAAGQLDGPVGIAVDPASGHLYVADAKNSRVSEFTVWGEFVKAFGWGVRDGAAELQSCGPGATPPSATCLEGTQGDGPGQFTALTEGGGIAVGAAGDVFVGDMANHRVQKFDSEGNFELMIGGEVDKGPNHPGNLCTAAFIAEGDSCGAGTLGEGAGQFKTQQLGTYIATGPEGHLFVGDVGRIQEFDADGNFESEVSGEFGGETIRSLAIDAAGNFYVGYIGKDDVHKLDPAGAELASFPVLSGGPWMSIALDSAGNVYVIEDPPGGNLGNRGHVVAFSPDGSKLIPTKEEEEEEKKASLEGKGFEHFAEVEGASIGGFGTVPALATSSACGIPGHDLYVVSNPKTEKSESNVRGYGPEPDPKACPPPAGAPEITAQYAVAANSDGAVLKARINPRLFADAAYYVEYGTGKCSAGGCEAKLPGPPGISLGQTVSFPVATKGVVLPGLQPATTYRFRFVAQSGGGGPVFGVAPGEGEEASFAAGREGTFTTPALPVPPPSPDPCPNAAFRSADSAFLADCRAYEMVSPVDKNGGDVLPLFNTTNDSAALNQSAPGGEKITYSAFTAFGDAQSSSFTSQYIAGRDPASGWSTHAISPPRGISFNLFYDMEFRAFSADLCSGWLLHNADPALAAGAVEGFSNLYRRNNCDEEGYEALTTVKPPSGSATVYTPELQGVSVDGEVAAFRVNDRLTSNASNAVDIHGEPFYQCYEAAGGKLRLISVLPNGTASKLHCSVGTANAGPLVGLRTGTVSHAISEDGSRIFWTASKFPFGTGQIYARIDGKNPTVAVSEAGEALSGGSGARFWTAAADGSKAIYSVGSLEDGNAELYEFDADGEVTKLVAGKVRGHLGASADASRIYLVSEEALAGGASADQPNLYLYEAGGGGSFSFIATLPDADAVSEPEGRNTSPIDIFPYKHLSWVNADGLHAAFMSTGSLTGFDNLDADSGKADAEVYRYDAGAEDLVCASCNPTGVRPSGRELRVEGEPSGVWAAAQIPAAETQFHAPRVLSASGQRLFFESYEALVSRDTNAKQDVYQWEAPGEGSCTPSSPSYSSSNGGCLSLISSGGSPSDSELVDSSADGRDVFFLTGSSLLAQDPDQLDIYDARAQGGFPPPPAPPGPCQGDACQSPTGAPDDPTPASAGFAGPGNLKVRAKPRCPRGKARRRGRCVAKKQRGGKHRKATANHGRAKR
jgi:hypothetical protein